MRVQQKPPSSFVQSQSLVVVAVVVVVVFFARAIARADCVVDVDGPWPVGRITNHGVPQVQHMHSQLVPPPGVRPQ